MEECQRVVPTKVVQVHQALCEEGITNALTTLFWFAGSIALAVHIGGPWNCGANTYCGSAEAAIAFGFFLWALFTALTVIDALEAMRSRGHNTGSNFGQKGPSAYPGA